MSIKATPRSAFDPLPPHNPTSKDLMAEQVEWFSGSTDIEVTKSSEDRPVHVKTAAHPQARLGPAGIPLRWNFSRDQSER
jgi:hypothetical protein